jgi:chemotaxis signal transduction protein/CheY-like chemotaxis protein
MKDKRNFTLPSNKLINNFQTNIAELLEFRLRDKTGQEYRFAVNISKVLQVMPLDLADTGYEGHEFLLGSIMVRDRVIPLVDLASYFKMPRDSVKKSSTKNLIVMNFLKGHYGLVVDQVSRIHYINWQDVHEAGPAADDRFHAIGMVETEGTAKPMTLLDFEYIIMDIFQLDLNTNHDTDLSSFKDKRLAIIDDSMVARTVVQTTLAKQGVNIRAFRSAGQFLSQQDVNFQPFDALVIDIEMPGKDGLVLTDRLRQDSRYQDTTIVVYSSLDDNSVKTKARAAGADYYVVKYDVDDLFTALSQIP